MVQWSHPDTYMFAVVLILANSVVIFTSFNSESVRITGVCSLLDLEVDD